ncbi:toprim domain-containing protein [Eggerthella sinensis]|uniref:toprim domain-containing protein n=1 Tax=Eggerthella sinensis TaxID=242230 RepID=UPI00248E0A08|nr:toprim domain-containing protein [Eggerthella sinensis]
MNGYADAQVQVVREALPDYLQRVHGVQNARKAFRCVHPAHEDRHPSMSYDQRACRVKCFSCGACGDAFDVAGWDTGAESFPDKMRAAAAGAGIDIGDPDPAYRPRRAARLKPARPKPKPVEGADASEAVLAAHANLYAPQGAAALEHLRRRGFSDEEICRNGWGWVEHPRIVFPTGFEGAPANAGGYICLPFPEDENWEAVRYAVFRPLGGGKGRKELKRAGTPSPIWREYLLRRGCEAVYITEGIFDAVALAALLGVNACAMCGSNAGRVLDVVADTPRAERPAYVIATDNDKGGRAFADALSKGFAEIGARFSALPSYPDGAKDAADVLLAARGRA